MISVAKRVAGADDDFVVLRIYDKSKVWLAQWSYFRVDVVK
jgi:hypothetical protein